MAMIRVNLDDVFYPLSDPVALPLLAAGDELPDGEYIIDEDGNILTDETGGFWTWQ